jgi:hypothetical protein
MSTPSSKTKTRGKLKIGDDWNAITIIALSQSFAKELVLRNFVGIPADALLERMVELSLRAEEHI